MLLRHIFPTLLVLCLSNSVFSQENAEKNNDDLATRIGLKGGLSIATLIKTNDNNFSSTPLYGFNGGGVLQLPLGKIISLQPEVLFSQKGYRPTGTGLPGDSNYRRYLTFLTFPLFLRSNPSKSLTSFAAPR